ncbi:Oidioi.mRNA.OKI2018_I69.chr2.g6306.t1.cds [Oikopleura dioica]|uniref:Oidioi.mRNA.OKI2018_I69.chr2.g6306.t1.cds n=1 Tax=Oikopleura dioica TaxID=34765 RepID=A0ABN7T307_OIKDI|nr:Oidioi.mRNA.OKI2018_I69.chr2.g6306.t1.cds [Oikopleura dioica]
MSDYVPIFKMPADKELRYCKLCFWAGTRKSHLRHLRTDHSELFLDGNRPRSSEFCSASEPTEERTYDISIEHFIIKEDNQGGKQLWARIKWNLNNNKRTRFQLSWAKGYVFFDNADLEETIKRTLQKQYTKCGAEKAKEIYDKMKTVATTHEFSNCAICFERIDIDDLCIFLTTAETTCSDKVIHGIHKNCRNTDIATDFVECPHCRQKGYFYPFLNPGTADNKQVPGDNVIILDDTFDDMPPLSPL